MHEFDLIKEYFTWENSTFNQPSDVIKSVGDDAAILEIEATQQLVISVDTFISGVHFPEKTSAESIGHKALAVNLSDLAAMGATPRWFTMALTLPDIDPQWLTQFSHALKKLATQHKCFLVGGDTTRGPLSITIQVMGVIDKGRALLRSGAKIGDSIYVTGTLGDAAIGLQSLKKHLGLSEKQQKFCQQRLDRPTPQIRASQEISPFASSCIDISDGFLQDLNHILNASKCGAQINVASLPLSSALNNIPKKLALKAALSGGDDYELLFTIPQNRLSDFNKSVKKGGGGYYSKIGEIIAQTGLILDENNNNLHYSGFNHFS